MRETALEFLDVIFQQDIFSGFDLGENNGMTRGITTRIRVMHRGIRDNRVALGIWLSGNYDQGIKDLSRPD